MTKPSSASSNGRTVDVAVIAPTGRDAPMARRVLENLGIGAKVYDDIASLCDALRQNEAGVVLLAEEALTPEARAMLVDALDSQAPWSDVPVILITESSELSGVIAPDIASLATRGSIMLLERPVRLATLATTLTSALRARTRQYDVRDHIAERDAARAAAEAANRAKSEFLAVMSHELRTPLNAIAGYCEILQLGLHGPVTDAQRDALERIALSERHLLSLINDVLNLAKIESGRLNLDVEPVDVCVIARGIEVLILPQMTEKQLRYSNTFASDGTIALADAEKAGQVLVNLLSNAVKFTPRGGAVHLEISRADESVKCIVTDTGPGIPANKLDAIFEPFVQVGRTPSSGHEGTGLGLSISRNLARLMGGDLVAASMAPGGSTFTFSLPAAQQSR